VFSIFSLALVGTAQTQETAVEPQNGTIAPLLYLPVISSTYLCQGVTEILREECLALVWLYLHTRGRNWSYQDGWLTEVSPCTWYGVVCTDGHVTELVLNDNNLQGSLPPAIGDLVHLQQLDLGSHVTSFPAENLCRYRSNRQSQDDATQLNTPREISAPFLCVNRLVGTIPPQIKNLTKLRQLYLGDGAHVVINGNQLTLPPEIGNLGNLQELQLSGIQLTTLPPEIGNLSNLQDLQLSGNQLTTLPPEIGNLSGLQGLYLEQNQLTTLPIEITQLELWRGLSVSHNHLVSLANQQLIAWLDTHDPDWRETQTPP